MATEVILRLFADDRVEWCAVGGQTICQGEWPLSGSVVRCLLLPAEWVLRLETPRLSRSLQTLRQAIPFAIEDRLVAPVEHAHVALGAEDEPDKVVVRVVDRDRLRAVLDGLSQRGLSIRVACSEAEVLPAERGALLWFESGRVLLRPSPQSAVVVCEEGTLPALLKALPLASAESVTVFSASGVSEAATATLDGVLGAGRWTLVEAPASLCLSLSTAAPDDRRMVFGNLLQQDFAVRAASGDVMQWWKRAGWAAVLACTLLLLSLLIERQQLQTRLADTQTRMANLLREAVPGIAQVVDARTQLEAELNRLRRGASGGDDALALLAQISPVLAGSTRYTLQAVDYRAGSLELTLSAGDVTTLDGVRESLAALPGLTVELSGVTPGKGVVEGRLRIRGGAR